MELKKKTFVSIAGAGVLAVLLTGSVAFADTAQQGAPQAGGAWGRGHMMGRMPGVFGTVSAISGNTLTVTSKMPERPAAGTTPTQGSAPTMVTTTYTVDASSATVDKSGTTSSLSAIAVGDTVMIDGTITGTSVVAKTIHDGLPPKGEGPRGMGSQGVIMEGNGQPVVGGSVTAISGTTLTVATAQGNISYSIDASSATVKKGNATSSASAITVGDKVVVQGSVNGTSVTASSVVDQGAAQEGNTSGNGTPAPQGFMGMLHGFFQHLFGFF